MIHLNENYLSEDWEKSLNADERFPEANKKTREHIITEIRFQRRQMLTYFHIVLSEIRREEGDIKKYHENIINALKKIK